MIKKAEILKCSITNFTKFGSKRFTLDELARALGISKKTIYRYFKNKEDLVTCSIETLLNDYKEEINKIVTSNGNDPILCVILIYKRGFEYLKYFKPSFIFGLEKYYPKASKLFNGFSNELASSVIYNLLTQAQISGDIRPDVNVELVVKVYFFRIDNILFKTDNLFDLYGKQQLFKHMVVNNLKGVATSQYSNPYFNDF